MGELAATRWHRRVAVALFLLVWFSGAWMGSWEGNPNNQTRLFAAISLVEDGDATIDEFAPLTIDKARFGSHFYLDKAPGMTLMALPAVWAVGAATGERSADVPLVENDPRLSRFLLVRQWAAAATGPALLTAVAAALLFDLALGASGSAGGALVAALAYALGSPIWGWSTTLFGHAAVAALYVIAAWAIWRGTADTRSRPGLAVVAGLALGWAVVVEYQAVLAGAVLAAWALWRLRGRADAGRVVALAVLGGAVAGLPLLLYNLTAYGTVWRLGYQGVVGWEGMDQGLFGLTWPKPGVLREVLAGSHRGLVWVAPVLLLAPLGLAAAVRRRETRDLGAAAAGVVAVVLLVNAAYVYWDGGNSTGPRHAMPMAGLLALGLAWHWQKVGPGWERWLTVALLAVSVVENFVIAAADIMAPPQFDWPVWSIVWRLRFVNGDVRTAASSLWGWSPWTGLALWWAVAVPVLAWLGWAVRRVDAGEGAAGRKARLGRSH